MPCTYMNRDTAMWHIEAWNSLLSLNICNVAVGTPHSTYPALL